MKYEAWLKKMNSLYANKITIFYKDKNGLFRGVIYSSKEEAKDAYYRKIRKLLEKRRDIRKRFEFMRGDTWCCYIDSMTGDTIAKGRVEDKANVRYELFSYIKNTFFLEDVFFFAFGDSVELEPQFDYIRKVSYGSFIDEGDDK